MSDADPETLELFVEESLEGLGRCEQILLAAEKSPSRAPDAAGLAALFRDFHTVKGTSGFLGLNRILSLGHLSEDLLAKLRDGSLPAHPDHPGLLLLVVDALRDMVTEVQAGRGEGTRDIRELEQRLRAAMEGGPAPAPAPQSPRPAPQPAVKVEAPAAPAPRPEAPKPDAAAEPAAPAAQEPVEVHRESSDGSVRVNVTVLDRLMNLMGELVLARNQMVQLARTSRDGAAGMQGACQRLSHVTSDLQEQIMKTRMQPVARVFEKIPRMVRDLARSTGKQVQARIEGTATEIDKALVEAIRDPVMHIVRNSVDHGIEPPEERTRLGKPIEGRLSVRASHEGGLVSIEIEDDGRGLDPVKLRATAVKRGVLGAAEAERLSDREALDLIFRPGFSTAAQVTAISGRGVGMDVVRTHVERAGGQVELESTPGRGTTIRLKMPLTLAIVPALLVSAGKQRFAIPQVNLLELVHVDAEQAATTIQQVRGAPIYRLRGEVLPLVHLTRVLRLPERDAREGMHLVVLAVGSRRYGLVVDEVHDTEEIVIKPLHGALKRLPCYSGATVLGDGGVALILDAAGVAGMSGIDLGSGGRQAQAASTSQGGLRQSFLVCEAGDGQPVAVHLGLVARLETVPRDSIERLAGQEVVQYRDHIMPIVRPEALLPLGQAQPGEGQPLVVFDFGRQVGMAVNKVLDVVELEVPPESARGAPRFALGRLVIFQRSTLVLDVYGLVRELVPTFVDEKQGVDVPGRRRVLLVDDSCAMRTAIAGYLRASGLDVLEASSGREALRELAQLSAPLDALITDLEMPGMDGFAVIEAAHAQRPELPVWAWTFLDPGQVSERARALGARGCIHKLQREALLEALGGQGVGA